MTKIGLNFREQMFLQLHHPVTKMPIWLYFYCCHKPKREEARLLLPFRTQKRTKCFQFSVTGCYNERGKVASGIRSYQNMSLKSCCPNSIFLKSCIGNIQQNFQMSKVVFQTNLFSKGHLISKWFFWVVNFFQKTNEKSQLEVS